MQTIQTIVKNSLTKREAMRKVIHLLLVFTIPISIYLPLQLVVAIGCAVCIAYLAAEYFRVKGRYVPVITDVTDHCGRDHELKGWVLTPFYLALSITALLAISGGFVNFISRSAAYVSIVAATLGDASAALVGMRFGRHRHWLLRGKSVEGSLAFFVATFAGSLFFVNWQIAIAVAAISAIVEVFSGGFDNLTVPFSAAIVANYLISVV